MAKVAFITQWGDIPVHEPSPSGSHYENKYAEELDEYGKKHLAVVGKINIYEKIQRDMESCDIYNILNRVAHGDLSALNQREGTYIDCTNMPTTLMEYQNIVLKAKAEFYELPVEVRKQFDNSPEMYVSEMGTQAFLDKLAPYNEKMAKIKEAGNLAEYEKRVMEQAKFENDVAKAKGVTNEQE